MRTMALVLVFLAISACTTDPRTNILGTWQEVNGKEELSFYPDGKVVLTSSAASIAGTYEITREGNLEINLQFLHVFSVSESKRVEFKGDTMTIIDQNGKAVQYRRVRGK
jgi:uncharacterized protein (DUF2147 family)